jgi:Tol biopolymer transport system component
MPKRSLRTVTLLLLAFMTALAAAAATSHATAPGKNGRIAFRRWFDKDQTWGAIFTINPDGSGERQVTHPSQRTRDDQPDWSPDGSLLVFTRSAPNRPYAVYTVRPDGLALRRLTAACRKGARCPEYVVPAFSPDGRRIAFAGGPGIVVTDRNGRHERVVVRSRTEVEDPQFSPDGKRLAFVRTRPNGCCAIYVVGVDGRHPHRVTPWSLAAGDNPDWSPDGRWILFRSDVPRVKQSQIYVVHPDGSRLTRLTLFKRGTLVTSSSFSPDGKWIVFGATGTAGQPDVFIMRADGSGMRRVTRTKLWDSAPDWGPAG